MDEDKWIPDWETNKWCRDCAQAETWYCKIRIAIEDIKYLQHKYNVAPGGIVLKLAKEGKIYVEIDEILDKLSKRMCVRCKHFNLLGRIRPGLSWGDCIHCSKECFVEFGFGVDHTAEQCADFKEREDEK